MFTFIMIVIILMIVYSNTGELFDIYYQDNKI